MSLASLRSRSVKLYGYSAPVDATSQIAESTYTRLPSGDTDKCWWGTRGTTRGMQTHPTGAAQMVISAVYAFASEAPVQVNGLIVDGTEYHRITAILPRDIGRDEVQVLTVRVDDDAAGFTLVEA